jgi:hypothetical protein
MVPPERRTTMPPQGLFEGDIEPPQKPSPVEPRIRRLTLSHILQTLLLVGLGVLIWQVVLLRRAVVESRPSTHTGAMEVEVVNRRPIKVDVDNSELDVHVTNPDLDVNVTNTVSVSNY